MFYYLYRFYFLFYLDLEKIIYFYFWLLIFYISI